MQPNILDYLNWRGDLSFFADPFNEVDALVLSAATYVEFDQIVSSDFRTQISLEEAAILFQEHLDENKYRKVGLIVPDEVIALFLQMSQCDRYKNLKLSGYINHIDEENEKQFAAITIQNNNGEVYVIYRGTDDTIIGWREDFNMAFLEVVPAQKEAALYLRAAMKAIKGKYRVMGHSKGGNLAVFSAVHCGKIGQKRLLKVYSMDGPGFSNEFFELNNYIEIDEKILWYLPYESIIGAVMEHGTNDYIVNSTAKGIMQHNPFSWVVNRCSYIKADELSKESVLAHAIIEECLNGLTLSQRRQFVNLVFDILDSTEAKTLSDISLKRMITLIDSVKNIDSDSRKLFKEIWNVVLKTVKDNR